MPQDISPLWISLKTALVATIVTFFLGIAAAYWMSGYRGKWRSLIEGLFISPLILPPTVVGFLLLVLLGRNGPIGQLLLPLNLTVIFTWYAAAIAATVVAFPLMYRTALGAFEQIDSNLLQVARTLGGSEWRIFWRVTLPLSVPGLLAGTTLAFARALGEFGATLMLAGNIPGQTQTIPMAIYFAVEAGAMNEAGFWTLVILGISLSGIVAVNTWQDATRRRSEGPGKWAGPGRSAPTIELQTSSLDSLGPSSGLVVDMQKQLPGFTLDVRFTTDGQTLGLLGASGAGKSMILRCLTGTETPTSGQIVLNGKVLFDSQAKINLPSRHRRIGFLVQNYALFPHLNVTQNIAFGLPTGRATAQQVEAQLAAVQLEGFGDRYPHQLSGGQQQRVALARALASQPEALLLDEPFSALDTHLRSQLEQQMITRLSNYQGVTLFVTHNLEEAYRVCQNLLVMEQGKAVACGPKQHIFEHPQTVSVARLTGCKNVSQAEVAGPNQIRALNWNCILQVIEPLPDSLTSVGIRAHDITFTNNPDGRNTFPCWLVQTSETPHRMTLFVKLHTPPADLQDYHLQAEVFKEKWALLKEYPVPWYLSLDPLRLFLMRQEMS